VDWVPVVPGEVGLAGEAVEGGRDSKTYEKRFGRGGVSGGLSKGSKIVRHPRTGKSVKGEEGVGEKSKKNAINGQRVFKKVHIDSAKLEMKRNDEGRIQKLTCGQKTSVVRKGNVGPLGQEKGKAGGYQIPSKRKRRGRPGCTPFKGCVKGAWEPKGGGWGNWGSEGGIRCSKGRLKKSPRGKWAEPTRFPMKKAGAGDQPAGFM